MEVGPAQLVSTGIVTHCLSIILLPSYMRGTTNIKALTYGTDVFENKGARRETSDAVNIQRKASVGVDHTLSSTA